MQKFQTDDGNFEFTKGIFEKVVTSADCIDMIQIT